MLCISSWAEEVRRTIEAKIEISPEMREIFKVQGGLERRVVGQDEKRSG